MNRETFEDLCNTWHEAELKLSRAKGHDYATEDVLANFKRMYKICKLYNIDPTKRPQDVFWFYLFIKIDRLRNLICSDKIPQNEAVTDSYRDISLYLKLLRAFLKEGENNES